MKIAESEIEQNYRACCITGNRRFQGEVIATSESRVSLPYKPSVDVEIGDRLRSYSSLCTCVTAKCFRFGYRRLEKRFGSCYTLGKYPNHVLNA